MAKRRKIKKNFLLIIAFVMFFIVYLISFSLFTGLEKSKKEPVKVEQSEKDEDKRPLINQITSEEKIYLSDTKVENIRIEDDYWDNFKVLFSEFTQVRKPDSYTPVYNGYSANGIRFSTDLNFFRVYTIDKEEYYKVPVATKNELEKNLGQSIYLSFDFIRQYKSWNSVKITYNGETTKIYKWKFDDLSYKMGSKRQVGKIQPQKSKERSEYNFTIDIKGEYYETKIETMGKDYIKISTSEGDRVAHSYYEVHTGLYDYLVTDLFRLEGK